MFRSIVFCGFLALGVSHAAAKTLCVNPSGSNGCSATIGAAVKAAGSGDQISVGAGIYAESVLITQPVTLTGAGPSLTIINAKGLANGIYVDGLDNPGLANVTISGLTVEYANFEGILLTNVSNSLISNSHVTDNNQSLNFTAGTCPGLPIFETNEGEDCGEGIHLVGTFAVTVANSTIDSNSGGILLSDETGQTYNNVISGNSIHDNVLDCGVTLASHSPSPQASAKLPYGVVDNTIVGNTVARNGILGFGAGVGIFAPGPGNLAYGNQVIGNTITDNGLPGVTIHNHAAPPGAPGVNLNAILIVGNLISGNGADGEDAATPGTAGINVYGVAPIYLTQIVQNTILNEANDVVMNNPGGMEVHMNNLLGGKVAINNLGAGGINGGLNFFGCQGGPGATGCGTVKGSNVVSTPYLSGPAGAGAAPKK